MEICHGIYNTRKNTGSVAFCYSIIILRAELFESPQFSSQVSSRMYDCPIVNEVYVIRFLQEVAWIFINKNKFPKS